MFDPWTDEPGLAAGLAELAAGFVFFPLVFYTLQRTLRGSTLCASYGLRSHGVYDICNKLTSSLFAGLACYSGAYVLARCDGGLLKERFHILENYLIFGLSYFLYDCVSMYMVYSTEKKEEVTFTTGEIVRFCLDKPLIILHHLLVPLVGFPALMFTRGGEGDCLLAASFLMEFSTPFVSLRVILCQLNLKDSSLYIVNGLLMLISFFLCRVSMFPLLYIWYTRIAGLSALLSIPAWVHLAVAGLWFPQLVWFCKMVKGSIKLISQRRQRKRAE